MSSARQRAKFAQVTPRRRKRAAPGGVSLDTVAAPTELMANHHYPPKTISLLALRRRQPNRYSPGSHSALTQLEWSGPARPTPSVMSGAVFGTKLAADTRRN